MISRLLSALLLIFLSPIFVVVSILIFLDDGFPIFFKQKRVGLNNSIFSIYKNYSECPIYMVQKRPVLAKKQGMYSIIAMDGRILKRGHDLSNVLKVFNQKTLRIVKS